jgi:hypothetical protein
VSHDSTLMNALEPGQLVAATMQPLPRRKLSRRVLTLLILLRVYILAAIPVIAYAFVHALLAARQ